MEEISSRGFIEALEKTMEKEYAYSFAFGMAWAVLSEPQKKILMEHAKNRGTKKEEEQN